MAGLALLFATPAFLCALVCALIDPRGRMGVGTYLLVPICLVIGVALIAAVFLREALICLVMLAVPWLGAGLVGALLFHRLRRRAGEGDDALHESALMVLPLLLLANEVAAPPPWQERVVARQVDVAAAPEAVWPLLFALPAIQPHEGRRTVTHDLLGVPRPVSAIVVGGVRHARWAGRVRFDEAITRVIPGRALGWRFAFPDRSVAERTDRHIHPDGPMLTVLSGGYRLARRADGGTRLTLETRYRMRVHAAAYAGLWGELILGDIQTNVLAIVAARARR